MKRIVFAALILMLSGMASAATATEVWYVYKGSTKLAGAYSSLSLCQAAARLLKPAKRYYCESAVIVDPLPPAPPATQTCPDGSLILASAVCPVVAPPVVLPPDPPPVVIVPPPPAPPPVMQGGVPVDTSSLPAPGAGRGEDLLVPTTELPQPSDIGAFRTVCLFAKASFDDPIVHPGQPGSAHLHYFFGNTGADAFSTADSIANAGNSTCRGGTVNRTAYWVPGMLDVRNGKAVAPALILLYYKPGYTVPAAKMQPIPTGLRMVAGDPTRTTPLAGGPTFFTCINNAGENSGFTATLPNCAVGTTMWQSVKFPQCWDGVNLDSPDHKSHMAYPSNGACPAAHPVLFPEITYQVMYLITEVGQALNWRLASDMAELPPPMAGAATNGYGYSMHGDWFNGWKPDAMASFVMNCLVASKDCRAHLLGNGQQLVEFDGN